MASLIDQTIGGFVNVLLNDYGIDKTNQNAGAKIVRKLSNLTIINYVQYVMTIK